ncbi:hypothetical protein YA52_04180 [Enterobacter roggenkampii]|nr:hypothetical protein YA52_04180 [Enterobacter roggenkampii]
MWCEKKIIIFVVLLIASFILVPDSWINDVFMQHIQISGDGEEAMNNYDFTAILIKFGLSAMIAFVLMMLMKVLKK